MYTTWREYKNHSGSTKTEGWSELSFHPWEDAGNSSTAGEENSKISSLHYWRKVLMDCLLVYCAMKIHLLTDLTWGLQGTDLTKHFGELLKWLLALWPLAWRLSHPVCSITRAHCHASWLNQESCLTLLVGCVHTVLMYQMAGLKSVSTGAFGLDFSLFISLSILLRCSYLRKSLLGFLSEYNQNQWRGQQVFRPAVWAGVKGAFLRFIRVFYALFFAKSQSVLNYVHHFLSSYGYRNSCS